jgi:F0F1-type ATP synthase assembly protein I
MNTPKDESQTRKVLRSSNQAGDYIGLGIQFAVTIFLCLIGGWWLDQKLSTVPLFLFLGTFLGAGGGFYSFYKRLMNIEKKRQEQEKR